MSMIKIFGNVDKMTKTTSRKHSKLYQRKKTSLSGGTWLWRSKPKAFQDGRWLVNCRYKLGPPASLIRKGLDALALGVQGLFLSCEKLHESKELFLQYTFPTAATANTFRELLQTFTNGKFSYDKFYILNGTVVRIK